MDPFGIALILFVSALFSGGLAAYAWRRRGTPGTGIVFFLMLGTTIAVFAYGMELLSTTLADKMIWVRIRYTGTALIYPMYLLFALWHTNKQKWLAAGRVALLLVLPVFSVIGLFTNSLHHLHYTWVGLDTNGPFPMIVKTYGPLYGFYVITSFGYVLLALAILGSNYLLTPSFFRRQTAALLIGTGVPLAAALLYIAGVKPLGGLNILPFAYILSSLTAAWIILGQKLFGLRPVAHGTIFENMTDGFVVLNKELKIVDANPPALRLLNLSPEALGQFGNRAFVRHPSLIRLIHSEPHGHVQIEQDGRIFDAFRASLTDQQKNLAGHLISLRDVTSIKRAENALRQSELRFRQISHLTSDILYSCTTDQDGNFAIDWISGNTAAVTGYSIEEIKAQSCWRFLVTEEDLSLFEENVTGLDPGQSRTADLRLRHKNGKTVWVVSHAECVREPQDPETIRLYGGLVDITSRKRAEEELLKNESQYRFLTENMNDVLWMMDLNLRTVYVTPSIEAVLGFTQEERLRQSVEEQLTPQSLRIARETLARERVFEGQPGYLTRKVTLELEFYHRDGSTRRLETIVSGLFDDQGRLTGLYGVSRDVTERKETETRILQYSEALRERNKELHCLYSVSELVRKEEISQEDILSASASLIAQSYFCPEITGCRISWEDREYKTENFAPTSWMQTSAIRVRGKEVGKIDVCYLELRPEKDEGPFLKEERKFLDGIAGLLGKSYERRLAVGEREKLIGELQNALQEVKTLTGMLPICASCKKIRNDQGYWEKIERYIGERSSVRFSHGICPECAQKLYPDLNLKK